MALHCSLFPCCVANRGSECCVTSTAIVRKQYVSMVVCQLLVYRKWCRLGSDPKDAEEFVDQACKDGRIMPNAATVNNLNKLWDTHEQLHG